MKVTTEELQQLKAVSRSIFPRRPIEKLLGMFPEGIPFPMAASLLENALRDCRRADHRADAGKSWRRCRVRRRRLP